MKFENFGLGMVKGMAVTILHAFRRPVVAQYPEKQLYISRRSRGNELVWSKERCTGCATCAKSCPQGAIEIVTATDMAENKYKVETYRVDTGYCIQCGLCVEACPYDALFMGYSFERAKYRRAELVQTNEQLLESPQRPVSGYYHPDIAKKLHKQTLLIEKAWEKKK